MFEFLFKRSVKFSGISQAEDSESLISNSSNSDTLQDSRRPVSIYLYCFLNFALTFAIAASIGAWIGSRWFRNTDSFCTKHVSEYCKHEFDKSCIFLADGIHSTGNGGRRHFVPTSTIQWFAIKRKHVSTKCRT
jgi:hypothetical protein